MKRLLCLPLALVLGCAPADSAPQVQGAYAAAVPPSLTVSAAYFNLKNPSDRPLVITGVQSDRAPDTSLMITTRQGSPGAPHHSDLIGMEDVPTLTVPPRSTHRFAPGGDHVMLRGLARGLAVGENVTITLHLEGGGELSFSAEARLP